MNDRSPWHYLPPPGPILSMLLIGLMLASGLLYYRAIKIQRFLEPALALSHPRKEFGDTVGRAFAKEFGASSVNGIVVKSSSIFWEKNSHYFGPHGLSATGVDDVKKLARIFLTLMKNDRSRSEVSLVLIIGRYPSLGRTGNIAARMEVQKMVGLIQDALFSSEPELGIRYPQYFAGVAQATSPHEGNWNTVEFRIVPSEFLHVEVLEKLEKYSY